MGTILLPLFPFTSVIRETKIVWSRTVLALLKLICGLTWRVTGVENIPKGNFILASKHQSALETIVLPLIFRNPVFVLKKELVQIPIFGTYLKKMGMIYIDRSQGQRAIHNIKKQLLCLPKGSVVVIFPEGTRTRAGLITEKYQSGVALIYETLKYPVLPVAVDTGIFWPKTGGVMPGIASIKILKPINPERLDAQNTMQNGYDRKLFLQHLNKVIETASLDLYNQNQSISKSLARHQRW